MKVIDLIAGKGRICCGVQLKELCYFCPRCGQALRLDSHDPAKPKFMYQCKNCADLGGGWHMGYVDQVMRGKFCPNCGAEADELLQVIAWGEPTAHADKSTKTDLPAQADQPGSEEEKEEG